MLIVTCSGLTRVLTLPVLGCSPRPRKRPGGSTRKLPTFCLRPSQRHSHSLLLCAFGLKMLEDRLEITLLELQDLNFLSFVVCSMASIVKVFLEIGKEVLDEGRVFDIVS
ncbi:hypothetical protein KCU61_g215, partial [Aureobasidium melanogenum]